MDRQEAHDVTIPIKPLTIRTVNDGKVGERVLGWRLNRVDDMEWTQDRSGVHVCIHWVIKTNRVRLDVMREADAEPLQSFAGKANNVRKHAIRWLSDNVGVAARIMGLSRCGISLQHASHIGAELARCDAERIDYVQD